MSDATTVDEKIAELKQIAEENPEILDSLSGMERAIAEAILGR